MLMSTQWFAVHAKPRQERDSFCAKAIPLDNSVQAQAGAAEDCVSGVSR